MTQGSGGGPADRNDTEEEHASGDAGDGEVVSGSAAAPEAESEASEDSEDSDGEAPSDESGSESESDVEQDVEPGPSGPSGTKLGNAGEVAREAQARKEMDWLMTVSPEASGLRKIVPPEEGKAPVPPPPEFSAVPLGEDEDFFDPDAQTRPDIVPKGLEDIERRRAASASGEFESSPELDEPGESAAKPIVRVGPRPALPGRVSGPAARETKEDLEVPRAKGEPPVEAKSDADDDGFERVLTTGHAANSRPAEPVLADDSSSGGGRGVWIAGIVVVGAVAAFLGLRNGDESSNEVESKPKVAGVDPKPPAEKVEAPKPPVEKVEPRDPTTHSDATPPEPPPRDDPADPPRVEEPPPTPPEPVSSDPREPPPGTPAAIAAVFKKIPVSPSDQAPVGGIGATGIHIDRIDMGASYENRQCTGETKNFSLARGDRPSVCIRVVHQRQPEDLAVLWEKKDGAVRRSKVSVKAAHAYRTRAYLVLRREYIGDWTVKIESTDGVELASYDFSVVE